MPIINESENIDNICEVETAEELNKEEVAEDICAAEEEELPKENLVSSTYQQGIDDFYQSQAERQKARRRNWTPFMNTFYTSCLHLSMRKTWTSSVQTF
ncbi:MAG: hypothetical protein IJ710_09805 [Prevotella sp.]|nr:hypothetical protein [Prevotella sp.]